PAPRGGRSRSTRDDPHRIFPSPSTPQRAASREPRGHSPRTGPRREVQSIPSTPFATPDPRGGAQGEPRMQDGERSLAVFIDSENLPLGFQARRDRFDIGRVLERLVEKGKIVAKKAYADWSRFAPYTAPLHEAAIELVEIPRRGQTGKNSADIRL